LIVRFRKYAVSSRVFLPWVTTTPATPGLTAKMPLMLVASVSKFSSLMSGLRILINLLDLDFYKLLDFRYCLDKVLSEDCASFVLCHIGWAGTGPGDCPARGEHPDQRKFVVNGLLSPAGKIAGNPDANPAAAKFRSNSGMFSPQRLAARGRQAVRA
jgi:hypothetical protein